MAIIVLDYVCIACEERCNAVVEDRLAKCRTFPRCKPCARLDGDLTVDQMRQVMDSEDQSIVYRTLVERRR